MSFRPKPSEVKAGVRSADETGKTALLADQGDAPYEGHQSAQPLSSQVAAGASNEVPEAANDEVPEAANDQVPEAVSADVPCQLRMGGALHKSGFRRSDVSSNVSGPWEIVGEDSQILLVRLSPGEEVMVEPGGMLTKKSTTQATLDMGSCTNAIKRSCCAGESCFRVIWKPADADVISITPYFPSKVLPIDLNKYSNGLFIKRKAWMASLTRDTEFKVVTAPSLSTACCAGQGCFFTAMKGSGMAFLNVGGTVVERELEVGEQLVLDDPSLVAWEPTVKLDTVRAGGMSVMCCGGQGLFNAVLTGPGLVVIQSMSFEKARQAYMAAARGNKPKGGVSIASDLV